MKKALLALLLMVIISLGWLSVGSTLDPALLSKAKQEYRRNRGKLRNARYLTIIDYRRSILENRLYVYDLQKQEKSSKREYPTPSVLVSSTQRRFLTRREASRVVMARFYPGKPIRENLVTRCASTG